MLCGRYKAATAFQTAAEVARLTHNTWKTQVAGESFGTIADETRYLTIIRC